MPMMPQQVDRSNASKSGGTTLLNWVQTIVIFQMLYMKTWLIVKEDHMEEAKNQFKDSGVSITPEGRRHLGAAVGTPQFISAYVEQKVAEWVKEVERLSSIAITQLHAAYAAFTHGLKHKWTYLTRTIPNINQPLEDVIRHKFLPSLTGQKQLEEGNASLKREGSIELARYSPHR